MGYMRHHAIVVTSWETDKLEEAHGVASGLFPWVSSISPEAVNGYRSFFVPPDGSKEGWGASDEGDQRRAEFLDWMDGQRYEDNSCPLDYVEVQYGDDDLQTMVTQDSDRFLRAEYA